MAAPHNGLGIVLAAEGKRDEAISEYRLATQLGRKDAGSR
jgi:Flp pilus assembly protein TadD